MTTPRQVLDQEISEKDFKEQIRQLAVLMGWRVYFTWTSLHSPAGFPDLFMIHVEKQRSLALEVKREKGKLTDTQAEWLTGLQTCGISAYVVRPSEWEQICRWLE